MLINAPLFFERFKRMEKRSRINHPKYQNPSYGNFGRGFFVASHQSSEMIHATEMGKMYVQLLKLA